jgi:monothiol glutaredoxin
LNFHGVEYETRNVLASEELRNGIKEFTSWPTIPQVFIDGEFVGGCDILRQMHSDGELEKLLKKAD